MATKKSEPAEDGVVLKIEDTFERYADGVPLAVSADVSDDSEPKSGQKAASTKEKS